MYLTNASISALFRRIELFAALSGLFFAHNSLKINCFHHWDGLYIRFWDLEWKENEIAAEDDLSELLQHEYDHLDGILAVSRAVDARSFALRSQRDSLNTG